MARTPRTVEDWLKELGEARSAGVFRLDAANQATPIVTCDLPWRKEAAPIRVSLPARRASGSARRAMYGFAAAAAVALAFVGIWQIEARLGSPDKADPAHLNFAQANSHKEISNPKEPALSQPSLEGDFNGDGVVDGQDIQAYLVARARGDGKVDMKANDFAKMLLGS